MSAAGFGDVYVAPAVKVGLLSADRPPQAGSRAELPMLREGLGDLLALADHDTIPVAELEAATHLCLCAGPRSKDGELLRQVLFETVQVAPVLIPSGTATWRSKDDDIVCQSAGMLASPCGAPL